MPRHTVFIVEDDADIAGLIRHHLEASRFSTHVFADGRSVVQEAERVPPSLFILDVMLPGKDGFDLCREIRKSSAVSATPVIFLTAKNGEADLIRGLKLGADDYISKPFSPRELVARVKAVLRRFERPLLSSPVRVGDIELDSSAMTLTVRGKANATTTTEFRLLEYFVRNMGCVVTRDQILDSVWGRQAYVSPRSVDVYVRRVRAKIERDPENPVYLKTLRGAGYRFDFRDRLTNGTFVPPDDLQDTGRT